MTHRLGDPQQDLFATEKPAFELSLDQRRQLLLLIMAMLIEITTASTRTEAEVSDDEDHA